MAILDVLRMCPYPTMIVDTDGQIWAISFHDKIIADKSIFDNTYRASVIEQDLGLRNNINCVITVVKSDGRCPVLCHESHYVKLTDREILAIYEMVRPIISKCDMKF